MLYLTQYARTQTRTLLHKFTRGEPQTCGLTLTSDNHLSTDFQGTKITTLLSEKSKRSLLKAN